MNAPGETLKLQEDGIKKYVQNKAGINLKKHRTPACRNKPVNTCTSRPAGREIDRSQYAQGS
jgi:hypothetical protein